jgi:hypothetical protein
MKVKTIITVALVVVIAGLAYLLAQGIMKPLKFEEQYKERSSQVINKLKDIRAIQETFRSANGRYCSSLDSLLIFLEAGKVPLVQKTGTIPDGMTEADALKSGALKKDTLYVTVLEKLYSALIYPEKKGRADSLGLFTPKAEIKNLKYIPFTDNSEVFAMNAKMLERSGIMVPVFEATADISTYTKGMKEQDIINKKADIEGKNKYAGWKVGDLTQPIIDGNFE